MLVKNNLPVLLIGDRGCGKTTLAQQVAEELNLPFYSISCTRQTTLSHLLGFLNVTGVYVPSHFRRAIEDGGVFLLDEIDASDPNVILTLNTIENGYVTFPDKIVPVHKDFRLLATANPFDEHAEYTGRSKLDAATLDRFDIITIDRDTHLENALISAGTRIIVKEFRKVLKSANLKKTQLTMRDALRIDTRLKLGLTTYHVFDKVQQVYPQLMETFYAKVDTILTDSESATVASISTAKTPQALYTLLRVQTANYGDDNDSI